ncbi:xanthine dehydrogenase family protein molybdopterin-binding subunit [Archangium violaceum]|uniref:xanthine dehydrogenase family protein molybdopterin-binding subunit n=1 Tax=Archangium violaceum TaxID=83451 RepID=UPI002B2A3767|nr:xanthine dehydrogenase family protein molybdopterin-binding subunit [Archangium violaceum]
MKTDQEKNNPVVLSRRSFVQSTAATVAGLVLGFHLPANPMRRSEAFAAEAEGKVSSEAKEAKLNTWLRIAPDGVITIYVARSEMGQGVFTSMSMIIAEELEADWSKIRVEPAPSGPEFNYTGQPFEITGGSMSIRTTWDILQRIGAIARHMLVAAAAQKWGVTPESCHAEQGFVVHKASGRKAGFGELTAAAAALPVDTIPKEPKLKTRAEYKLIGKPMKRLDTPAKVSGKPLFGIDVVVPDMVYAAVRHSPVFGGECSNFAELAKAMPAGTTLVKTTGAIIAVADSWWTAKTVIGGLEPKWTKGATTGQSSATIEKKLRTAASGKKNPVATKKGEPDKALATAKTKLEAEYSTPFLAHTPMEPLNCTAHVKPDGIEIWVGTQSHTLTKLLVSNATKVPQDKIVVHTTYLGGGFGRRAGSDEVMQAIVASKAVGKPVKLIWSREEDVQHDFYRPATLVKMKAGLGEDGLPVAITASIAGPSIMERWTVFGGVGKDGIDMTTIEGLADLKYECPNQHIQAAIVDTGVPVGFWRSVGSSHNAFYVESFMDELAHAAKQDPYKFRRALLEKSHPRFVKVLDTVARMSKWETPPAEGRFRGIAIAESFGSIVGEVAEVSVTADGRLTVHKVWVAVDCGRYVNPDTIVAQMEGGVVYGLSAALRGQITLRNGRVEQSNFHDASMLAPYEMPEVAVEIVDSGEAPGGVGEPGVPPIAPAVTNAIFAATGKRLRTLPISNHKLTGGKPT